MFFKRGQDRRRNRARDSKTDLKESTSKQNRTEQKKRKGEQDRDIQKYRIQIFGNPWKRQPKQKIPSLWKQPRCIVLTMTPAPVVNGMRQGVETDCWLGYVCCLFVEGKVRMNPGWTDKLIGKVRWIPIHKNKQIDREGSFESLKIGAILTAMYEEVDSLKKEETNTRWREGSFWIPFLQSEEKR